MRKNKQALERLIQPLSWSRTTRRLFLLFLPISIFLFCLLAIFLVATAIVETAVRPFLVFWTAEPRPLRRRIGYSYDSRHAGRTSGRYDTRAHGTVRTALEEELVMNVCHGSKYSSRSSMKQSPNPFS